MGAWAAGLGLKQLSRLGGPFVEAAAVPGWASRQLVPREQRHGVAVRHCCLAHASAVLGTREPLQRVWQSSCVGQSVVESTAIVTSSAERCPGSPLGRARCGRWLRLASEPPHESSVVT
jgi:hypothetical protein